MGEQTTGPRMVAVPIDVSLGDAMQAIDLVRRLGLLANAEEVFGLFPAGTWVEGDANRPPFTNYPMLPDMVIRRGGVRFPTVAEPSELVASGGWCAPSPEFVFGSPSWPSTEPAEPVPPCDGVNHRWEKAIGSFCHECGNRSGPRELECEACPVTLREDADGLPPGHFERLWKAAPDG